MGLGQGHIGQPSGFKKGFGSGGFAPPNQSPPTAPSQVTGLSALSDTDTIINLSWTAPSNGGSAITGYFIERKIGAGAWATLVADTGTTATTYSNTGLTMSTLYTYRVSAINSVGTGSASSEANATTFDTVASGYFTRAGITDVTERASANTFITTCRANANVWASITSGAVYLVSPTSYGASLYNAMGNTFNPQEGVAPNYSTSNGWTFDGVTQYLRTGLIPSTTLTNHSHTTIMALKGAINGGTGQMGASDSTTARLSFKQRGGAGTAVFCAYATANLYAPANTSSDGYFTFSQSSNTFREMVRNGTSLGTSGSGGNGTLPTREMYLGALNNVGVASLFHYANMIGFVQTTVYLSKADSDILANALETYNTNVISGGR